MAELKPEQQRVKSLLIDTVTLLCKNSLQFDKDLSVEGLLGVSIDHSEVFFVHISKNFKNDIEVTKAAVQSNPAEHSDQYISLNQSVPSRHKRQLGKGNGTDQGLRRTYGSNTKNHELTRTSKNGNLASNIIKQEVAEVTDFEENGPENGFTAASKIANPARIIGHRRHSPRQKSECSGDESTASGWVSPHHLNLNTSNGRSSEVDTGDREENDDDIYTSSGGCNEPPAKRRLDREPDFVRRKSEEIYSASVQQFQSELAMSNEVKNEYFIGHDSHGMAGFVWSEHLGDEVELHHVSNQQSKHTGQSIQEIDASSSTWCPDVYVTNKIGDEHDGQEDRATCPICGKSYSKKQNMLRHRQTHYYQNGYVCPVCKKGFKRSDVLRTHMRRHRLHDSSTSSSGLISSRLQTDYIRSDK